MSALREHLETAMLVEMYTIPLYLFAGYSIKNRASKEAKDIFRKLADVEQIAQAFF